MCPPVNTAVDEIHSSVLRRQPEKNNFKIQVCLIVCQRVTLKIELKSKLDREIWDSGFDHCKIHEHIHNDLKVKSSPTAFVDQRIVYFN